MPQAAAPCFGSGYQPGPGKPDRLSPVCRLLCRDTRGRLIRGTLEDAGMGSLVEIRGKADGMLPFWNFLSQLAVMGRFPNPFLIKMEMSSKKPMTHSPSDTIF